LLRPIFCSVIPLEGESLFYFGRITRAPQKTFPRLPSFYTATPIDAPLTIPHNPRNSLNRKTVRKISIAFILPVARQRVIKANKRRI
jgi:hypothetical protein